MPRTKPRVAPFPHPGYRDASCVQLADGSVTTVDDADLEAVQPYLWRRVGKKYVTTQEDKKYLYLHRFLMGVADRPRSVHVDHINGDGMDNRRCNLRLATGSQNGANGAMRRPRTNGITSAYRGVIWEASRSRWKAATTIRGKMAFFGRFHSEEEAARAYDRGTFAEWGQFARLNFPEEGH